MELERYQTIVNDPQKTKEDLQQMYKNAVAKDNLEHAVIVKTALDTRFPGWDKPRTRRGGATPTNASFLEIKKSFPTAKEAYIWLIEKFIKAYPELLNQINWETEFVIKGKKRNYFGRAPERMFYTSPHLADERSNWEHLSNRWYVNLNLSNREKFLILCRFSAVAKLNDWSWKVIGERPSIDISEL